MSGTNGPKSHGSLSYPIPPQPLTPRTALQHVRSALQDATHWRWKNSFIFLAIIMGVTGIFAVFNFQGAFVDQFRYFVQRPIQVEATGSTLLWLAVASSKIDGKRDKATI